MPEIISTPLQALPAEETPPQISTGRIRKVVPSPSECGMAFVSALLLICSFPDFNLWLLAWVALIPLFLVVAHHPNPGRAFFLGWIFGTVFFYGSCYWLTYSMIHFGGISRWVAFPLLFPGALLVGIFPGLVCTFLAHNIRKWGPVALFSAAILWPVFEWMRIQTTGQLWNAVGYSQAYHATLIQAASWGGVYAITLIIVLINAALTHALVVRTRNALAISGFAILFGAVVILATNKFSPSVEAVTYKDPAALVVAVQPNVPMDLIKTSEDLSKLTERHFEMSDEVLRSLPQDGKARLVIWPESPMNFAYGTNNQLRALLANFARTHNTSILLNSQEVAPNDGLFNSAMLINQEGSLVAQYDKIRLLPFGSMFRCRSGCRERV